MLPAHLQKLGELVVRCTCIEKRCVDLIILKDEPNLVTEFNAGKIGASHANGRLRWHRETFQAILGEFKVRYSAEISATALLDFDLVAEMRDVLIHGDASRHRTNVLFVANSDKRRGRLDNILKPDIGPGGDDGTRVFDLNSPQLGKFETFLTRCEQQITGVANSLGIVGDRIW
ncbi:MAG: hypothetical protein IPJ65_28560 [Archangiaceae bacterium]|nr:hypothetical protein [Archangiaceae bacterium]